MAELFRNYINGQWVEGAGTFENRNPADTGEVVGLCAKGTFSRRDGGGRGRAGGVSRLGRNGRAGAGQPPVQSRRYPGPQLRADLRGNDARGRQDAPGVEGRSAALHQHLSLLRRRRRAPAGHAGPSRTRPRPHVQPSQAAGRGGPDHAMEFPERDSGLEAGAGADLRQHGCDEAGQRGSAELLAHRGGLPRGRHPQGRGELRVRARAANSARRWSKPAR